MDKEVIVAIIGGIAAIATGFIGRQSGRKKASKDEEPNIKLEYHQLFTKLDALVLTLETEFHLDNVGKEKVFREVLIKKIDIFKARLLDLAKETDQCYASCDTENCNKLFNRNMDVLVEAIEEYNNFFYNSNYTPAEQQCLSIVMGKFNMWHSSRVADTKSAIEMICSSKFYHDCVTKQAIIFDWLTGAFVGTVIDAEHTLNSINGDLRGLVFRGTEIL